MMKKPLVFAFCAMLFCTGFVCAEDVDSARAAVRGASIINTSTTSSRADSREQRAHQQSSATKSNQQTSVRGTVPRAAANVKTRAAVAQVAQPREVLSRSAVNPSVKSRNPDANIASTHVGGRAIKNPTRVGTLSVPRSAMVARSGVSSTRTIGKPATGYKLCRDTFFQCMDEFCANKDAQLKRCACSARIHEFDNIKKTLNTVEQKLLDFNERLLAVNMDKEDAAAMSIATEGELAFQQDDKSDSKNILNTIMKKLKSANADTQSANNFSAMSLSMDTNVFDTIDPEMGIETTVKEGENLYKAALPTCLEMAAEVCEPDEIPIAQNAYTAAIEQDCNTVSKTYAGLKDKTLEKVREGGALLEMSRLNNQQTRNSDDILACKKKMLDALSDSSVCGKDMGKCLDWSGKYINPATGSAILTSDLSQLGDMITRPTGNEKWSKAGQNKKFVTFLESKKKYLEPSMKNCESLGSVVWASFLEDALAQIKLAQEQKLEEMRQSCTTITTQCMMNTSGSLVDFDSRALSIFGVSYDKNVNQICADVKTACTALINGQETDGYWGEAIGNIATAKTLDQIITTCTEVGKNCIIRNCMNLESKFGLCQSETSIIRTNLLNLNIDNPCWGEVQECVAAAGTPVISNIMTNIGKFGSLNENGEIVETFVGNGSYTRDPISGTTTLAQSTSMHLWCVDNSNIYADLCRITERIWGNCSKSPSISDSLILNTGLQSDSLLAWFAENTNQSCNGSTCNPGYILSNNGCSTDDQLASDITYCVTSTDNPLTLFSVVNPSDGDVPNPVNYSTESWEQGDGWSNCCAGDNSMDYFGNCCGVNKSKVVPNLNFAATASYSGESDNQVEHDMCSSSDNNKFAVAFNVPSDIDGYKSGMNFLVCVGGDILGSPPIDEYPNGDTINCSGRWIVINKTNGTYRNPNYSSGTSPAEPNNYYSLNILTGTTCVFDFAEECWKLNGTGDCNTSGCDKIDSWPLDDDNNLFISY